MEPSLVDLLHKDWVNRNPIIADVDVIDMLSDKYNLTVSETRRILIQRGLLWNEYTTTKLES